MQDLAVTRVNVAGPEDICTLQETVVSSWTQWTVSEGNS